MPLPQTGRVEETAELVTDDTASLLAAAEDVPDDSAELAAAEDDELATWSLQSVLQAPGVMSELAMPASHVSQTSTYPSPQ